MLKAVAVLHYAVCAFIIAIAAAVFGFGGLPGGAASLAWTLFFVFMLVAAVMVVFGLLVRRED
jgi:uncharacterized membrane protein YtjA (UPF0391 family)